MSALNRRLPIGVQDFEKIREGGFVYVDKTAFVYRLAHGGAAYFLSRPRRFGKSLLVSTLKAYFEGRRALFAGLDAERLHAQSPEPDAWAEHAVLRLDFSTERYAEGGHLEVRLDAFLCGLEKIYGSEPARTTFATRFEYAIQQAHARSGRRVVVLVDEYDKPLLDAAGDAALRERNREALRGFYGVLKGCDEHLRFVLLAGVTKFGRLSVFSDLNQLDDISLSRDYAAACGITEAELRAGFAPEIDALAAEQGLSREECLRALARMYDGYRFHPEGPGVYNPFSLLNAFGKRELRAYWFATGTPTFLVKMLKESGCDIRSLADGGISVSGRALTGYRADGPDPVPLLYQSGYLTIRGYDRVLQEYELGYPNDEVKLAFVESLAPAYLHSPGDAPLSFASFYRDIRSGDLGSLMSRFRALFARLPYPAVPGGTPAEDGIIERNFQNVFYIVFTLMGQYAQVELHSARGRADCVLQAEGAVYIFEFKRDGTAAEALAQIGARGYAEPFAADPRPVVRVGVAPYGCCCNVPLGLIVQVLPLGVTENLPRSFSSVVVAPVSRASTFVPSAYVSGVIVATGVAAVRARVIVMYALLRRYTSLF